MQKHTQGSRPRAAAAATTAAGSFRAEPLESRVLFAFAAQVSFQPPSTPVPAGYAADTGQPYGPRAGGLAYGWGGLNVNTFDRNAAGSPDQRHDAFAVVRPSGPAAAWEIKVPNGTYQVNITAGDPTTVGDAYRVTAEGVTVVNGSQSVAARWVEGSQVVTVTDGRLTVRSASGIAKVNSINIAEPGTGASPPATPPAAGQPTYAPSGMSVAVSAGKAKLPSGATVSFAGRTLSFAAPQVRGDTQTVAAPVNYSTKLGGNSQSWFAALPLVPAADQPFRGGLFHGVLPDSVSVKSTDGGRTFVAGTDYRLNPEWGQIANLDNRLGTPGSGKVTVSYRYVTQRLDLIQVLPNGQLSVKQGVSVTVCPELPAPDAGAAALAGVYVYTLDGARESGFSIRPADVLPINPAAPVAPVNTAALSKTLAKLRSGAPVNIAFHGDSITAGAEVKMPNGDRSKTYTGRVMAGLKQRFPKSAIRETYASLGGISAEFNVGVFKKNVLDAHDAGRKIDLVLIALGMNDPAKPVTNFKTPLTEMIRQAKARGMDVLLVTTMPFSPATEGKYTGTKKAVVAQATREVGAAENVALADVYAEWMNLPTKGIPSFVPIHNWSTHPGEYGQALYADTILRSFPA